MSKHTEGPWIVRASQPQYHSCVFEIDDPYRHLTDEERNAAWSRHPDMVDEANRHLIAAAPELLEACERVADAERILLGLLDRNLPGWRKDYLFNEMFDQVRAAIAQAKGDPT